MDEFLVAGCLGYDQRDGPERRAEARKMLDDDPGLADASIYSACMLGRSGTVAAMLELDPDLATKTGGPRDWPALLYVAYGRVEARRDGESYLAAAKSLLAAGADPDCCWVWDGTYRFTALTGCFGEGEGGPRAQPQHVEGLELAALLLQRGADPNDGQALYNRMFTDGSVCLRMLLDAGLTAQDRLNWPVDDPPPTTTLSYQLFHAAQQGFVERVELLITAGVDVAEERDGCGVWKAAMLAGQPAAAELVRKAGAAVEDLDRIDEFTAAFRSGDIAAAQTLLGETSGLLDDVEARFGDLVAHAAAAGDVPALALLLAQGVDINRNPHTPSAHQAAYHGKIEALKFLLANGADPRLHDMRFNATALGWAQHAGQAEAAAVLEAFGLES